MNTWAFAFATDSWVSANRGSELLRLYLKKDECQAVVNPGISHFRFLLAASISLAVIECARVVVCGVALQRILVFGLDRCLTGF